MKTMAMALATLFAFAGSTAVAADSDVAARVNGTAIPTSAVDKLAARIASGAGTPVEQVWNDARDQLIAAELLAQQAQTEKVTVSSSEVDKEINDFKQQLGGQEAFQKNLADSQTTESEFREESRRSLLAQKLFDKHVRVGVTDEEVEKYYKDNEDQFQHPELLRASHILIKVPDPNAAADAHKRAEEILARAKKGEDFAKLAKEVSQDPRTKDQGGDLGFFPQRSTPVAEAAFKLKTGEVSDVIESSYGLHIIKAVARRPAGLAPLAEVKDDIRSLMADDQRQEKEDAYAEQLKKKAKIEILQDKPASAKPDEK